MYRYPLSLHKNTYASSSRTFFFPTCFFSSRNFCSPWHLIAPFAGASDMSQSCSQSYTNPKQALKWPKRKAFYNRGSTITSHHKKCDHQKLRIIFIRKNTSHHKKYLTSKYYTSRHVFFYKNHLMLQIIFFTKKLHK